MDCHLCGELLLGSRTSVPPRAARHSAPTSPKTHQQPQTPSGQNPHSPYPTPHTRIVTTAIQTPTKAGINESPKKTLIHRA